ncbi:MAG: FMN-binding protein [Patescibacteria group bacterium]
MKRFLISIVFIGGFAAYVFNERGEAETTPIVANPVSSISPTPFTPTASTPPAAGPAPVPTIPKTTPAAPTPVVTPTKPVGQYKDDTYTGTAANAYYGYIQVAAVISGGKLTDVTFLQYPNDRRESIFINQQAMPILKSEAIEAQSASVSGVSGASDTSAAFKQSLGSALSQART